MSTPNPTPDPDAEKKSDLARRLEALRGTPEPVGNPTTADTLPNLPAQMVLVLLSRLNATHVNAAKVNEATGDAIKSGLLEIKGQLVTKKTLSDSSEALRGGLVTMNNRLIQIQAMLEEMTFRILLGTVALGLIVVGLAVMLGTILGSHR